MLDILTRAGSFIGIILLGFFLKKIGFFRDEDFTILSRITIRITLPATIVTSFAGKQIDPSMLSLTFLAIACGLIYIGIGYVINRKNSTEQQAFEMLSRLVITFLPRSKHLFVWPMINNSLVFPMRLNSFASL